MKGLRNFLFGVTGSFIWMVVYQGFIGDTAEHWPSHYRTLRYVLIAAFGALYVWMFLIRPFRAGLRGEKGDS
jgi:hypothetical protein